MPMSKTENSESESGKNQSNPSSNRSTPQRASLIMYNPPEMLSDGLNRSKSDEILLMAKTSSTVSDVLDNRAEDVLKEGSIRFSVPKEVEEFEAYLNIISEKTEDSRPGKNLAIQQMPQINIRPSLTLQKVLDIEIKATGSFSFRSPTFRNIHYEEMYFPQTKATAQQTSSTLLNDKHDMVDEKCSCGFEDIKVDLVPVAELEGAPEESTSLEALSKSDTDAVELISEKSDKTYKSISEKNSSSVSDLKLSEKSRSESFEPSKTAPIASSIYNSRRSSNAKPEESKSDWPMEQELNQEATDSALLKEKEIHSDDPLKVELVNSEMVEDSAVFARDASTLKAIPEQINIFEVKSKIIAKPEEDVAVENSNQPLDEELNRGSTSTPRRKAIDIRRGQLPKHLAQINKIVTEMEKSNAKRPTQLTEPLENSRATIGESQSQIKYINEAYREQTLSERQFGPHPESSTSVPEAEPQVSPVPELKIPFDSDFYVECECNAGGVSLQKSSGSVHVLTHDVSVQVAAPTQKKSSGEKRSNLLRGSKARRPLKHSTFKSPINGSSKSMPRSSSKGSTQRQGSSKNRRRSTDSDRPNSTSESLHVAASEESKRSKSSPQQALWQDDDDDQPSTVMSLVIQQQVPKSFYPRLHKARNCRDLDTSSSEFDGYSKLRKFHLADDTMVLSPPYNMYCGDYMRNYQVNSRSDVEKEFKKAVKRSTVSSGSSTTSRRLEETLSEGEIRCKCSISIGELHICRYVQQIKNRVSRMHRGDSARKLDASGSLPEINSTETSSDT